ncbi:hypothetical protein TCA2_1712 [Paenibacillus sp. TCA20]|uniref:Uncharacterized protein n=1 Tax=Paenibacillus urinalis TaxID=521520 RepID=A0AAX3MWM8_9BACL|nr:MULTISPECIES: hypothetical protein [Paenibacillus]WDH80850.1 hypothetical protein PUW23_15020 [Paenibacillus urinalis]GAK39224.1 hypothetical protein TCA2_1712 [Paenibacillus sp. TCA20]
MKIKNIVIIISILLNLGLIAYIYSRSDHMEDVYSGMSFNLQHELIQLEGSIGYQIEKDWSEADTVIEKIEDINEDIDTLMDTGKALALISEEQEEDLWNLSRYFSQFPTYSGYPNTDLTASDMNELVELRNNLRSVGWGMHVGYSGDWDSFSAKIYELIRL